MKSITKVAVAGLVAATAFVLFVPTWTPIPRSAQEVGFPQEILFESPSAHADYNRVPPALPPAETGGPAATAVYQNVQVLTDISAAEFMRLQTAITQWVSPKEGCAFCHTGTDYASDAVPAKLAARVMLRMTRHLNSDWSSHVAAAGVTCYSCHRGQPVPAEIWFPSPPVLQRPFVALQDDWRESADTVRKFFPDAGYAQYFLGDEPIAVQSSTVGLSNTVASQVEVKRIYEMMMTLSDGIGANCGYCHNSRNWADWSESTPYRWIGYYALRMMRDLNRNYLLPIAALAPQTRTLEGETRLPVVPPRETGAQLGNGLVLCGTCHMGSTKPMGGANMVHDYPGLTPAAAGK